MVIILLDAAVGFCLRFTLAKDIDLSFIAPKMIGLISPPPNPALPKQQRIPPTRYSALGSPSGLGVDTIGVGATRVYLDIQSAPPNVAYPPRPVPGSVADMDIIMKHCDFSENKVCDSPQCTT